MADLDKTADNFYEGQWDMTPRRIDNVLVWGSDIEESTITQAAQASRLPFVQGHLALMPDAHIGIGSTVGSVIPTQGAIIPAAVGVDIGCVDADTEYLSSMGWRRIANYSGGEVMQYHPETGRADFVEPLQFICRKQDTFLWFKTKYGIDQMLTPDHRVLCWNRVGRDRHPEMVVVSAEEFASRHSTLKLGNRALFETSFSPILPSALSLDDDALRVQVMFIADGSITGHTGVVHFKKERKIERARKLLDAADIPFTDHTNNGLTTLRFRPPVLSKSYSWCWPASLDQLRVIADECIEWDGNEDDQVFYSRLKSSADFIHYAFAATGYRSVMRKDSSEGGDDYRVYRYQETRVAMAGAPKSDITIVDSPDGYAYCFTVPSGFLVLRRGGNIFVTGNCGMIAVETDLVADGLPDDLAKMHSWIAGVVPAGVGKGHDHAPRSFDRASIPGHFSQKEAATAANQFGTLGSGNHFVEICLDERDRVWVVLHSGSRGIGNQLAKKHIDGAKKLMKKYFIELEDLDLAYLVEGTPDFDIYIADMLWAQQYALGNRNAMMDAVLTQLWGFVGVDREYGVGNEVRRINCHHNFTQKEHHHGRNVWLTRKGAIKAGPDDYGVIPGSMGTSSYIVRGLGNPASYQSCSHGAGRRLSRSAARKTLSVESLETAMTGRTWNSSDANALLDEHPDSYKSIDQVMADQVDLVSVEHTLHQILNYKGL